MKSGYAAQIQDAQGPIGVFLEGEITLTYTSMDPREHAALQWNLGRNGKLPAKLSASDGLAITIPSARLILWTLDTSIAPSGSPASEPKVLSHFDTQFAKFARRGGVSPWPYLLRARYNPSTAPSYLAFIDAKDDFIYSYDPDWERSENLYLRKDSIQEFPEEKEGQNALVPYSTFPLGRPLGEAAPRRLVQEALDLDLSVSKSGRAALQAKVQFSSILRPYRLLTFEYQDRIYDRYLVGYDRPITRVQDDKGRDLPFHILENNLFVLLPEPAQPGKPLSLTFESDRLPVMFQGNDNAWLLSSEAWLPRTSLYEVRQKVHAIIHTDLPYHPVAAGKTIREWEDEKRAHVELSLDQPGSFYTVLGGAYSTYKEQINGRTFRVATYALQGGNQKLLARLAAETIQHYEPILGPFPCNDEFLIAQVHSFGWGQAPPGMMLITNEAFAPGGSLWHMLYSQGINHRFFHEIAHQYWGNQVMWESDEDAWLSESFADYSASLLLVQARGKNGDQSLISDWEMGAKECEGIGSIPKANMLFDPVRPAFSDRFQTFLLYRKGPLLLRAIHQKIGDRQFRIFLRSFQKSFKGGWGSTKHVQGLLEFMTHTSWKDFFAQYFDRAEAAPH